MSLPSVNPGQGFFLGQSSVGVPARGTPAMQQRAQANADAQQPPAYRADAPYASAIPNNDAYLEDPPPSHYADRVAQLNPDGKQRWGDPRPKLERSEFDIITVPIKVSDYGVTPLHEEQRTSKMSKLKALVTSGSTGDSHTAIFMTRGEYSRYWAKDHSGNFRDGIVEPEGGRKAWLEEQMVLSEEYLKQEKDYKKALHKMPQGDGRRASLKWIVKEAQDVMDW